MSKPSDVSRDREVFQLLRAIYGQKNKDVARRAGSSPSTIAKWRKPVRDGGVRRPQFYTMQRVARAAGLQFKLMPAVANRHADSEHRASP